MLEAEHERILERTWQLAGHASALREPGSYLTCEAGTQPVLVVRGKDGKLRAFRNVPALRLPRAQRLGPMRKGDPVSLPRLDLPPRRVTDRDA